ncbi:hypothetical protein [Nitrospirillum sp. BR 11828]|uniref:hypothetical protein n=1 Tax=Nitrospirillum sp. BR 11828 TaxID=3104325 RepID=UPI002ACAFB01|nr:hypothetical protein [Nitrospirillum sp. BR 11828]MDZ5647416.1 hypothetical protein [Nitrospirillum sp. BR 11828]
MLLKTVFLPLTAAGFGAVAGLWDLTSASLDGTLVMLAVAGFLLAVAAPQQWGVWVLVIGVGVLLAHLVTPARPGMLFDLTVVSGLVAGAVALLPAAVGAVVALAVLWVLRPALPIGQSTQGSLSPATLAHRGADAARRVAGRVATFNGNSLGGGPLGGRASLDAGD